MFPTFSFSFSIPLPCYLSIQRLQSHILEMRRAYPGHIEDHRVTTLNTGLSSSRRFCMLQLLHHVNKHLNPQLLSENQNPNREASLTTTVTGRRNNKLQQPKHGTSTPAKSHRYTYLTGTRCIARAKYIYGRYMLLGTTLSHTSSIGSWKFYSRCNAYLPKKSGREISLRFHRGLPRLQNRNPSICERIQHGALANSASCPALAV